MTSIRWAQHQLHRQHLWKNDGQTKTESLPSDPLAEADNEAPTLAVLMGFMCADSVLWKFTHFLTFSKKPKTINTWSTLLEFCSQSPYPYSHSLHFSWTSVKGWLQSPQWLTQHDFHMARKLKKPSSTDREWGELPWWIESKAHESPAVPQWLLQSLLLLCAGRSHLMKLLLKLYSGFLCNVEVKRPVFFSKSSQILCTCSVMLIQAHSAHTCKKKNVSTLVLLWMYKGKMRFIVNEHLS